MKIKKLDDQQALDLFIELLETRITVATGFVRDLDNGNLTHQYLTLRSGELEMISTPEELEVPLRVANAQEVGQTVN